MVKLFFVNVEFEPMKEQQEIRSIFQLYRFLKQETHLPVFVDVTHSTGRRDFLLPCAKAALAIGADGVMAEVHPDPAVALSDSAQQMDLNQFDEFWNEIQKASFVKA